MDLNVLIEDALSRQLCERQVASLASVVVFHDGQVCLVKSKKDEHWTLPGGRADKGEDPAHTAARELAEETGIKVDPSELVFVGHVHRSKKRLDTIFTVEVEKVKALKTDGEIEEAKWVSTGHIPTLGFNQTKAVKAARKVLDTDPDERGLLVVFEGIDGSGKSTQVEKALEWLKKHDYPHVTTKWNSSTLVSKPIKQAKERKELSPGLYCLLHAADMTHRYEQVILPALRRNLVVVCDRYWYTGMVRDRIRGVKLDKAIFKEMRKPKLVFYCEVDPSVAVARVMKSKRLGYYSSGMDMDLAPSKEESAVEYERRMVKIYPKVLPAHTALDMSRKIGHVFDDVKAKLRSSLDNEFFYDSNHLEESAQGIVDFLL